MTIAVGIVTFLGTGWVARNVFSGSSTPEPQPKFSSVASAIVEPPTTTMPAAPSTPAALPTDWVRFTSPAGGYSFVAPAGATEEVDRGPEGSYPPIYTVTSIGQDVAVDALVFDDNLGPGAGATVSDLEAILRSSPFADKAVDVAPTTWNGLPALLFSYPPAAGGEASHGALVVSGTHQIVLTVDGPGASRALLEAVLASLQVTPS